MTTMAIPATRPSRAITPGRLFLAVALPLAPALVAAIRGLLPYFSATTSEAAAADVAGHLQAQNVVLWLGFAATFTLPVAAVLASRILRPGAPRLTTAAEVLLVPGYLALPSVLMGDAALYFGAHAELDTDLVARMYDGLHPSVVMGTAVFVVGHVLGTTLLGLAAIRGRLLPRWAGILLTICQPLHLVAFVVIGNQALDVFAWVLNAVVFAMLATIWVRHV